MKRAPGKGGRRGIKTRYLLGRTLSCPAAKRKATAELPAPGDGREKGTPYFQLETGLFRPGKGEESGAVAGPGGGGGGGFFHLKRERKEAPI